MKRIFIKSLFLLLVLTFMIYISVLGGRSNSYIMGMIFGYSLVVIGLIIKMYKEFKNPSYYEDERSLTIAYKAESITLRLLLLTIFVGTFISQIYTLPLTIFNIGMFLIMLTAFLKVGIYYYLIKRN
ncbi:MAG: DUF2178 domain-containing protein [Clostridia bacterium]|jgi:hypothetical protein|nr:DUF2178 domain-containing protein [Clostridia bacterium]